MRIHVLRILAFLLACAAAVPCGAQDKVTVLYDAFGESKELTKDWGFSAFVEHNGKRILFDTGQARARIMNQLQAVALNEGLRCKKRLWRERGREQLESFRLAPWASRRRHDLLELLDPTEPYDCRADASH